MGKFEINIPLTQETDVIHFQVDNDVAGATLRASSFKPALDKSMYHFLEKQINLGNPVNFEPWLLKNSDKTDKTVIKAFNYKMHITGTIKDSESTHSIYNNVSDTLKYLLFNKRKGKVNLNYYDDVNINIKSFVTDKISIVFDGKRNDYSLIEFVEKYIKIFLIVYNFGQRGLKGFGSFRATNDEIVSKAQLEDTIKTFFDDDYDAIVLDKSELTTKHEYYDYICKIIKGLRRDSNLRLAYPVEYLNLVNVNETKSRNANIDDIKQRTVVFKDNKTSFNAKIYNDQIKMLFGAASIPKRNKKGNIERYPSPISFSKYKNYLIILLNKPLIENFTNQFVLNSLKYKNSSATIGYKKMVFSLINKI